MKSPFPGMDPFLEGYLWPDVHNTLAHKIRQKLIPFIRPKYVARINTYTVEDDHPEKEIGIVYPDVEVMLKSTPGIVMEPVMSYTGYETMKAPDPALISIPFYPPVEVKIPVVEIRDSENNKLVTCIEILSPVNKRAPGFKAYREKRRKLHRAGVHLLEIDLLRRGTRPVQHPKLLPTDYLVALTRAEDSRTDVWPVSLRSRLPMVPVPLIMPDADVSIDIQQTLNEAYEEAAYELSINYRKEPPPPKLGEEDLGWVKSLFNL